jgi:hypothetical protein
MDYMALKIEGQLSVPLCFNVYTALPLVAGLCGVVSAQSTGLKTTILAAFYTTTHNSSEINLLVKSSTNILGFFY